MEQRRRGCKCREGQLPNSERDSPDVRAMHGAQHGSVARLVGPEEYGLQEGEGSSPTAQ